MDVLADVTADERAVEIVAGLKPEVVVVDVTPHDPRGIAIAHRIAAIVHGPRIVLTSSADAAQIGSGLDGYHFVAKGNICADALSRPREPDPS